jgi:hypothetical protein
VGGITFSGGCSYGWDGALTDSDGNVTLWLFRNTPGDSYTITAKPLPDAPYITLNVNNVTVNSDMTVVIVLPYSEPPPLGKFWIGLKNSDDQGTKFDLRSQLYLNGTLISEGQTLCITGVTRNPSNAKQVTVPFGPVSSGAYSPGDLLSLRVLTRIGTNPGGSKCSGPGGSHSNAVGLRLYYDAATRASNFGATVSSETFNYYLHAAGTDYFLDDLMPTGAVKYKDSGGVNYKNGNPWKEIGTWTMTLP